MRFKHRSTTFRAKCRGGVLNLIQSITEATSETTDYIIRVIDAFMNRYETGIGMDTTGALHHGVH